MTKKKSKKRSASNSVAPPEPITLFVDRCAWSRLLGEALEAIGANYIAHHQRFAPAAPDEEWLEVAGRESWAVLTRDKHIRRRPAELEAFQTHQVTFLFWQPAMPRRPKRPSSSPVSTTKSSAWPRRPNRPSCTA